MKGFFPYLFAFLVTLVGPGQVVVAMGEGCSFENRAYFEGQAVCQSGLRMKCVNGGWVQTGLPCSDEGEYRVKQPEAGSPRSLEQPQVPAVQQPDVPPAAE